jgi:hypothetical protein
MTMTSAGLTPQEVFALVHEASISLPSDQRERFIDRAMSWLAQYSAPSGNTVRSVLSVVKKDLGLGLARGTE